MSRSRALSLLLAATLLAACGTSTPTGGAGATPTGSPSGSSASATASGEPASTAPGGSQPVVTEAPTSSDTPTDVPSTTPTASAAPGAADACTGSADNRTFLVNVSLAVGWPVLCAVLPKGWLLSAGSYRLANGGKLVISYKGPGGATVVLSEGSFCGDGTGCVPSGTDGGDTAFGSMTGTLVTLGGGGFAIVVNRGATPSWLLEAHGPDRAAVEAFGAALVVVAS